MNGQMELEFDTESKCGCYGAVRIGEKLKAVARYELVQRYQCRRKASRLSMALRVGWDR